VSLPSIVAVTDETDNTMARPMMFNKATRMITTTCPVPQPPGSGRSTTPRVSWIMRLTDERYEGRATEASAIGLLLVEDEAMHVRGEVVTTLGIARVPVI
jgi:hypothetical protein